MKLALIDVCGTLYHSNTTFDFLEFFFRGRSAMRLLWVRLIRSLPLRALRKLLPFHWIDNSLRLSAIRLLSGQKTSTLETAARRFVKEVLTFRPHTPILSRLEDLERQGYRIVLLSGSLDFIVAAVAQSLNIKEWYGAETEVKEDRITGRILHDTHANKMKVAMELCTGAEVVEVITDNLEDRELFNLATHGVFVCRPKNRDWAQRMLPEYVELLEI